MLRSAIRHEASVSTWSSFRFAAAAFSSPPLFYASGLLAFWMLFEGCERSMMQFWMLRNLDAAILNVLYGPVPEGCY